MTIKKSKLISDPAETKRILRDNKVFYKKSLGQNFLIDSGVADKIADALEIAADDYVVEIGPGLGGLSQILLERTDRLSLVEIDQKLVAYLHKAFDGGEKQPEIIQADALLFDFAAHAGAKGYHSYKVAANLPYYITTPIVMHLLENGGPWRTMVFMMQKEVAERLMAAPGAKECGAISLAVQYRAEVEKILAVPPSAFIPQPGVESTVIRLLRRDKPPIGVKDESVLFKLIRAGFGQRRKTLHNALTNSGMGDKDLWRQAFPACGIDGQRRGETLSLAEYGLLADWYYERMREG